MIFAAGLGTRLKPLTDTLPKALVPVCERPLIEHVARKLFASGINEAVVNIHYFADKVEEWVNSQDWIVTSLDELSEGKMLFEISDERELLLETGGACCMHAAILKVAAGFSYIMSIFSRIAISVGSSRR